MLHALINEAVELKKELNSVKFLKDILYRLLKENGKVIQSYSSNSRDMYSVTLHMSLSDCSTICNSLNINMAEIFPENVSS